MIQIFIKSYGSLAFGAVLFLVIWFSVVKPEMDKKDFSYEEHRALSLQMAMTASALERSADTLERIAILRGANEQKTTEEN